MTVPAGGVREGQIFFLSSRGRAASPSSIIYGSLTNLNTEWTPLLVPSNSNHHNHNNNVYEGGGGGAWKDHWWDCFRFGFFHVSLWNACLCPQILAAQIMTRLNLNWLGDPVVIPSSQQAGGGGVQQQQQETSLSHPNHRTFYRVLLLVCLYWVVSTATAPHHPMMPVVDDVAAADVQVNVPEPLLFRSSCSYIFYHTVNAAFWLYTLIILTKLRHRVRRLDRIAPSQSCCYCCRNKINFSCIGSDSDVDSDSAVAVEDCCMAFWCGCCSVAQLARQTTDYTREPAAACCSSTGLLLSSSSVFSSSSSSRTLARGGGGSFPKRHSAPNVFVV